MEFIILITYNVQLMLESEGIILIMYSVQPSICEGNTWICLKSRIPGPDSGSESGKVQRFEQRFFDIWVSSGNQTWLAGK